MISTVLKQNKVHPDSVTQCDVGTVNKVAMSAQMSKQEPEQVCQALWKAMKKTDKS